MTPAERIDRQDHMRETVQIAPATDRQRRAFIDQVIENRRPIDLREHAAILQIIQFEPRAR